MQKYNLKKQSSKRSQNPSRYYNFTTNLKFQHKPKISSFKNPHIIKIDGLLLLLPSRGRKSLKLLYSIMNLNTISLPFLVDKANKHDLNNDIIASIYLRMNTLEMQ